MRDPHRFDTGQSYFKALYGTESLAFLATRSIKNLEHRMQKLPLRVNANCGDIQ